MSWNLKVQQILPYKKPNKQQEQKKPTIKKVRDFDSGTD